MGRTDKFLKTFKIEEYPNIQVNAGTINRQQLKACFLEFKGTFETNEEDKVRSINSVCREISRTVNSNINTDLFRKEFILDRNISDSFTFTGRSYTKLEFTFFIKRQTTFEELTDELNKLTKHICETNIKDSDTMKFHKNIISKRNYPKKNSLPL